MVADAPFPAARDVGVYILAGGASRRMGHSKARLELDGEAVARVLARRFAPHVASVSLVVKRESEYRDLGMPLLCDATPEHALVHGIRTVLESSGPAWRLLLACDMPDVGPALLSALWHTAQRTGALGSCPRLDEARGLEPLPSLWHRDLRAAMRPEWGLTARTWVQRARLAPWEPGPMEISTLQNINTADAWAQYIARRRVT
ncbi:MAG: molybdenum cofactor guanylyltransferase [Candidatus Latescibacterota bacterium]|nr:MAG: molybdenum cofactor guanylyltransferase [Candidatus Latescibacterota bacterium]